MAKRKLSNQQKRRIAGRHRRIGHADIEEESSGLFGDLQEGLVISRHSTQAEVLPVQPSSDRTPCRCHLRANIPDLVTGDRVMWRPGEPTGIVESVLPRHCLMARPDSRGQLRPVAANMDQIAVVIAAEPPPHQNLVDRYLVAIEHLGGQPLIVGNKVDLAKKESHPLRALTNLYTELGYSVVLVSANDRTGFEQLEDALRDHTTIFVGQSGVGKSSIINRLNPRAEATIGDLSQVAKGRHTTTAARYYSLPGGGNLIDSAGIREFRLGYLEPNQVAWGFVDFRPWLGHCKFRDCLHLSAEHCALAEAVNAGKIREERLASYRLIINDLANP